MLPISDKPEQIKTANIYIVTTTLPCNYSGLTLNQYGVASP
ncbi:hypothetical protein [Neisseria mucosa]|nr:hypothetical protein [Neisseria mucosa]